MKLTRILVPARNGNTVVIRAARVLALTNSDANHAGFFESSISIVTLELVVDIGQLTVTARLFRARSAGALSARTGRLFMLHGFLSFSLGRRRGLIPMGARVFVSRIGYRRTLFDGRRRVFHDCLSAVALFALATGRRHGRGGTRRVQRLVFGGLSCCCCCCYD